MSENRAERRRRRALERRGIYEDDDDYEYVITPTEKGKLIFDLAGGIEQFCSVADAAGLSISEAADAVLELKHAGFIDAQGRPILADGTLVFSDEDGTAP